MGKSSIHGVGINDADYLIRKIVNGKSTICPIYQIWANMITRCYSDKYQSRQPTYIGCTVCEEWLLFSNFRLWMVSQDYEGKALDKDIIVFGNKIYSPETCCFVPQELNSLLCDSAAIRGKFKQGVTWHKAGNKFQAQIKVNGKRKHLGLFISEESASDKYINEKIKIILAAAYYQTDMRVSDGLRNHAKELFNTKKVIK